ncbi:MAG: hypothetical protein IKM33_06180 [Clostridia bacterium]|nr:hypothetical protein [Clostridia bacterium]
MDILWKNATPVILRRPKDQIFPFGYDKAVAVENKGEQVCGKGIYFPHFFPHPVADKSGNASFSTEVWRIYPHIPLGAGWRKMGKFLINRRILEK